MKTVTYLQVIIFFITFSGFIVEHHPPGQASEFLTVLGWKDDVDLVVAPNGEFLVIPEQSPDDTTAQVTIMDLDPVFGTPLGVTYTTPVPGFENGVDVIVVPEPLDGSGNTVLVPVESADESEAGVLVLLVDADGFVLEETPIYLDDLGFREDVDGVYTPYGPPVLAFFALENGEGSARGILAIDVDPRVGEAGGPEHYCHEGGEYCT